MEKRTMIGDVIGHSGAKLHAVLLIAKKLKLGFEKKNQKSLA